MDLRPDDIAGTLDEARQNVVMDVQLSVAEERDGMSGWYIGNSSM